MAICDEIDKHTYFFWDFCNVVSWLAIIPLVFGIVSLIAGVSRNVPPDMAIGWATIVAAVETWFVCRFAIVVIKILDTLTNRASSTNEKRGREN
jgi:hypothetical protein